MLARDYQHVRGRLGIDVANHYATAILKHDVGGRVSIYDLTKEAVSFAHTRMITQPVIIFRRLRLPLLTEEK